MPSVHSLKWWITASMLLANSSRGGGSSRSGNIATGPSSFDVGTPDNTPGKTNGPDLLSASYDTSTNLVAGDSNRRTDVFVRDTTANPPPPPQTVSCVVPRVIGLRLATARKRITKAHCKVGRVRHRHTGPSRVGRVLSQSTRAGTRHAAGTKVNLAVGRR